MTRAAVCRGVGRGVEIEELRLSPPQQGELRVRVGAAAVCHSDLLITEGVLRGVFPMVLGHEGAGVVTEVGEDVTDFAVGDHVVATPLPQCGECWHCARGEQFLCERVAGSNLKGGMIDGSTRWVSSAGEAVHQLSGVGAFADELVMPALSAVRMDDDIPFQSAAMVGCRVLTGMGAALNTADITPGDTVVVIGCGGVGLSLIQGARIAGAKVIIAVDLLPTRLQYAKLVGATHTLHGNDDDLRDQVVAITGKRRADVVFDVVGAKATMDQALRLVRRGGEIVVVGVASNTVRFEVPAFNGLLVGSLTVKGSWLGGSHFRPDTTRALEYYRSGDLVLDDLTNDTFTLEDIGDAFAAGEQGTVATAVITFD